MASEAQNIKTTRRARIGKSKKGAPVYQVDAEAGDGLNADIIIDAALLEIDQHGLGAFRIRTLASRLDVYPAAIYWYIGSKDLILSEVVARVTSQVLPLQSGGDWKDQLRELFNRFREAVRAHPNVAPLLGGTLIGNAKADLRLVETILAALHDLGLRGVQLASGYSTVIAALVGFVSEEFATEPEKDFAVWQDQLRDRLGNVSAEQFPVLAANMPFLMNQAFIVRWENGAKAPLDTAFAQFIEVVLTGLAKMAEQV